MQCPLLYRFRVIDKLPRRPAPRPLAARSSTRCSSGSSTCLPPAAPSTRPPRWSRRSGRRCSRPSPSSAELVDGDDPEALALWVKDAVTLVERWFTLEDPTRLEPAERELYVETDLDGLTLRGYVDRLDVAPTGEVRVVDYKTGRSPSELFEGKALFQMKFYALVLWRLQRHGPPHAAAGLPRQQRDRPLHPRRGRPAGDRAQAQGLVAGDRAGGQHRRLAPAHEPAVRLVRPPRPLPRLGRHAARAARGREPCSRSTRARPPRSTPRRTESRHALPGDVGRAAARPALSPSQPADPTWACRPSRRMHGGRRAIRPVDVSLTCARPSDR